MRYFSAISGAPSLKHLQQGYDGRCFYRYFKIIKKMFASSDKLCIITNIDKRNGANEMKYIITEIKGYMNYMSFEAAVAKVRRNHLGGKEHLISQAAEMIKQG